MIAIDGSNLGIEALIPYPFYFFFSQTIPSGLYSSIYLSCGFEMLSNPLRQFKHDKEIMNLWAYQFDAAFEEMSLVCIKLLCHGGCSMVVGPINWRDGLCCPIFFHTPKYCFHITLPNSAEQVGDGVNLLQWQLVIMSSYGIHTRACDPEGNYVAHYAKRTWPRKFGLPS